MAGVARMTWPQASVVEPLAEAAAGCGVAAGAVVLAAVLSHKQQYP